MTEEQDKAVRAFAAASKRLSGSSGKSAGGIEAGYGEAYQALVRLGIAPQIKAKYR
jgi:hypothetical protein